MTWTEPAQWYAQLAAFHAAAAVFVTDAAGRALLVKPTYRDRWLFPGGYVEADEDPRHAAEREVREELAVDLDVGRLLVVDWAPAAGQRPRSLVSFVFDGGHVAADTTFTVDGVEVADVAFHPLQRCHGLLPAAIAPRVAAGFAARESGGTIYLVDGAVP